MPEPRPLSESSTDTEEHRTAERTECFLEVAISHEKNGFLAATILDISAGGVKLLVDPPPAPGEELRLTFLALDGRLFQLQATVIHYIDHGKSWAVGCRFARQLDETEMAALL